MACSEVNEPEMSIQNGMTEMMATSSTKSTAMRLKIMEGTSCRIDFVFIVCAP